MSKGKALIAMSGGVDSSVSALLMKDAGYDCIGVTMKLHEQCNSSDVDDAKACAERLGMPFGVVDFQDRFQECVMDPFVRAYENGITPNPCVDCNRNLKFEALFRYAEAEQCDLIVTGHYAQVAYDETSGRYVLKKGLDESKDQSYVLYSLTQEQLAHIQLPLGGMTKQAARDMAEKHQLGNAHKAESQDICFVPDGKFYDFIESYVGHAYPEGNFVDLEGNVLGKHKGIIRYTVGQRKGLGLALPAPMYVCKVDVENNEVVLCSNEELFSRKLKANGLNLISVAKIENPMEVMAKVRYKHIAAPAVVTQLDDDTIEVVFKDPQRAITKGQAVVLFDGDTVVGGATITETELD